jgi:ATP synthase protein I
MNGPPEEPREEPPSESDARFLRSIDRHAARRAYWLKHGERPLAQNLAMGGVLGWMVALPALAGVLLGRWLDRHLGSGITWTGALIFVGLAFGCWVAWRRIQEIQREESP